MAAIKNIIENIKTKATPVINFFKKRWVYTTLLIIAGIISLYLILDSILNIGYSVLVKDRIAEIDKLDIEKVEKIDRINEIRFKFLQVIAGIVGFVLVVVQIIRTFTFHRQVNEQRRANISSLTLDQYIKAVDQLNHSDTTVRLGGIYSFEKILNAKDKEVKGYHDTIIELLCTFIRENRPFKIEIYEKEPNKYRKKVEIYIQAILTVFGRRENRKKETIRINLSNTNLYEANLYEAHLENADLIEAHLENAYLLGAHLENANLSYVHLENAFLGSAHLENANLRGAHLENANLSHVHLENAFLGSAHLENAYLLGAHLENADLIEAHLENANLLEAHLENANLSHVHLENADLGSANLENADLSGANLENTNLWEAHLENANLYYANLKNIKLVPYWKPYWKEREETKEEIIGFIKELEKARDIKGIELDDKFMKIIEEEFPDLFKKVKGE